MATIAPGSLTQTIASPTLSSRPLPTANSALSKAAKASVTAQRVDLEPYYVALHRAIGDKNWTAYKEAVTLFVIGLLKQSELSERIDPFIGDDLNLEHLHNQFVAAILANAVRDPPEPGVASWVSANDKPTTAPKPAASDIAEQRLKQEVMRIPARERKRLKQIQDEPQDRLNQEIYEFHEARSIKPPDTGPATSGGFNKTNWELEIRKRFIQPLFAESNKFPDEETIEPRMMSICYEEGLGNGAAQGCTEILNTASEFFIKEALTDFLTKTHSNGELFIKTDKYKKQLDKEEEMNFKGELSKNPAGLLPVEAEEATKRKPLGMGDLRLALQLGSPYLGQAPFVSSQIINSKWDRDFEERESYDKMMKAKKAPQKAPQTNGVNGHPQQQYDPEAMEVDEDGTPWLWQGTTGQDESSMMTMLDDCLLVDD